MEGVTRRCFLQTTSLAAIGAACAPGTGTGSGATGDGEVPPPIAELSSRKDEAEPISVSERKARIEKGRRLMSDTGLDAVFMTGGTSLDYFTGMRWGVSERLLAVVLPVRGTAFVVAPAFEERRALEQIQEGPLAGEVTVYTWQEDEDPYERVATGLRKLKIAAGALGIEETVRSVFSRGVAEAAPALNLRSAIPVTAGCRRVKSAHELALMRLASEVTFEAYRAAFESLEEGMTQHDCSRLVTLAHERQGFEGHAGVQVGEYSALPHGSVTPQVVREGTILLIDGGCSVEGYRSDISRTFVLGRASDKMKRIFEIERRAQDAALAKAGPGVEAGAVDAAAREVIAEAGYGPGYAHFTHRVGHGIGMDGHEWPYLVKGNTLRLEPDMTFSDEPGIYIEGEFGVRLEDDMHITNDGAELFTPQSPSLEDPFGIPLGNST